MQEKSLRYRLMIIVSCIFILPSLVLCYIFFEQNVTLSPTHFVLFFLIIALAIIGIILVRYVFEAVSTTADFLKKATEGGENLSLNLRQEAVELNEISSSFNRLVERLEKTTESLDQTKEALHESEEEYHSIMENIEDGYYEVDIKGNLTFFNESMRKILGHEREKLVGMNNRHYTDEENSRKVYQTFNRVYQTGKPVKNFEWQIIRKDGTRRDVEVSISLIRNAEGHPTGFRGIVQDSTDRKQAEEDRKTLQERLQRAEKMEALGTLAGGVAHDLNNVLGGLVGYSELLLIDIPEGNAWRGHVSSILNSSLRAAAIIQDLLTLSRRGVATSEVVNLNKLIPDFIKTPEFEKMKAYHPHVSLKTDLEEGLLNIKGSQVHLGKTIMNLISNASEAISGQGEVIIRTTNCYIDKPIRGYDEMQEGDYVVLSVSDNGKGISASDIKKIFEPFYTKKVMGRSGTGLGLAVVWGTVKDHDGYIDVQSEDGKGSTFTIYFPATREEATGDEQKISPEQYMGRGETILVVDDVKEQREVAASMLTRLGYRVDAVSGGEEAIVYLKAGKVDIIVLDMIMDPGMDGLETYQRALAINPKQRAIIVSGFSETDRVHKALALGAGAYVRKPYMMEKIGMAVRRELLKVTNRDSSYLTTR
jgi:two-component system, cell cycle sensor histidine kinase and response regulator CckA